ncbi:hypothetical protein TSAR_009027 [Trichomalopsis sarcophagae]|uniref:Uncharacterized protein n=1 Tax=Trichomalopsis sarcophagae TaxID=543379 RepID=A0A232EGM1_9HYME|nr:hypothetical protein TSAR_009027 [Trichomalopsis sarcophagae]
MKKQWKFDQYACLTLLSWLSIRLYNDYNPFPLFPFQDQTRVPKIIIDEDITKHHDWMQNKRSEFVTNSYEITKSISLDEQPTKSNKIKDQQNFTERITPRVSLPKVHKQELLSIARTVVLMNSLYILGKYGLDLTRDLWRCKLLENKTEESRITILEFIEVSKPRLSHLVKDINCTEVSDIKTNTSDDATNFFAHSSVIVDSEANLLLAKHLEPRLGGFFKLLFWYFDNRNSQYYKNNENDVRVLTAKYCSIPI